QERLQERAHEDEERESHDAPRETIDRRLGSLACPSQAWSPAPPAERADERRGAGQSVRPSTPVERLVWEHCRSERCSLAGGCAPPPHHTRDHGVCRQPCGGLASPAARSSAPCILPTSAPGSSIHETRRFTSHRKAC